MEGGNGGRGWFRDHDELPCRDCNVVWYLDQASRKDLDDRLSLIPFYLGWRLVFHRCAQISRCNRPHKINVSIAKKKEFFIYLL